MSTTPNPNAPHIVLNVQPGAPSFTLNVGEGGCWVSFADKDTAPTEDMFTGCEALGGITALSDAPTTWEATRAAHAKAKAEKAALDASLRHGLVARGGELHRDMLRGIVERLRDACDYDNETREDLARVRLGEDTAEETGTTITCPISLRGKIKVAYWLVNERGERLGKKIKHSFEVGGNDDTDDAEDEGPEYDTVSQDDIQPGDIVEWHDGDNVFRFEVTALSQADGKLAVVMRNAGECGVDGMMNMALSLPLKGDPFILRPRS